MTPEQAFAMRDVPPARLSPGIADDLSARELEVLRLLAQGLTNVQIAERLVISPRTVNAHLRSIYTKLAVTSRTAATRYATRTSSFDALPQKIREHTRAHCQTSLLLLKLQLPCVCLQAKG